MDLQQVRAMMRVNKHRLDDELELQAYVQEQIGRTVAELRAKLVAAKESVDVAEAELVVKLRGHHEKLPVDEIKARVQANPARLQTAHVAASIAATLEQWEAVYDAWRSRGFALRNLCDLHGQQYFAVDSGPARHREPAFTSPAKQAAAREDVRSEGGISAEYQPSARRRLTAS